MSSDMLRDSACVRDVPQLVTEGVSEFLTDYKRPGYTEDALRQFVVLDDIEAGKGNRKEKPGEEGRDYSHDEEDESMSDGSSTGDGDDGDNSDIPMDEVDMMLDEGLPEDYKLRAEKLPNGKYVKKAQKGPCVNRRLQVVDDIFSNPFDVLPEGWVRVTHNTGISLYLHKASRVCSVTMPYFLGPGSARKHRIPLTAIPCLAYRKALEKEKKLKEQRENENESGENPGAREAESELEPQTKKLRINDEGAVTNGDKSALKKDKIAPKEDEKAIDGNTSVKPDKRKSTDETEKEGETSGNASEKDTGTSDRNDTQTNEEAAKNAVIERYKNCLTEGCPVPAGASALPKARIETAQENQESQSINHIELREYCQRLFRYRKIDVMRFKTWSERRRFAKTQKKERNLQRPSLPEGTKLITFPILAPAGDEAGAGNRIRKEWIMNPSGKSYVCILHECVQHALKTQPVYEFKDLENPATPYSATVSINKMKYGTGVGTSKRQAKSEAAKATLEVLIPEMRDKMDEDAQRSGPGLSRNQQTDLSFFDDIKIEDPRVHEFCSKTTEPSPHTILLTCLKRNFGLGDMDVKCEVKMLRHQKNEFTMTVGNHTATVICKNKREGKQRASQAILQAMHPHITSWGSLLRLYGNRSVKSLREKKQEEQEITVLQSRASANSPNWAILEKLKEAMMRLKERNAAVKPLGTFIPPSNVDLPMASSSNLNNLEL